MAYSLNMLGTGSDGRGDPLAEGAGAALGVKRFALELGLILGLAILAFWGLALLSYCLLYTSDAADD